MGNVSSITQSRQKYKRDLKEWKKMVDRQLAEKNKAIHDLREILRRQSKKNQSGYEIQEGLIQAIQRIEKQLKNKSIELDEKYENFEKRTRVLESRTSVLTSYLRETNKRIEQMNSSLEVTTHQTEETSDMISSLRTYFKELNRKMVDVAENVKRLGCNVCQLENRVNQDMTAGKQALLKTLLQEIYELEDEKDGLLKFAEDALGLGGQDRGTEHSDNLDSTLYKIR